MENERKIDRALEDFWREGQRRQEELYTSSVLMALMIIDQGRSASSL